MYMRERDNCCYSRHKNTSLSKFNVCYDSHYKDSIHRRRDNRNILLISGMTGDGVERSDFFLFSSQKSLYSFWKRYLKDWDWSSVINAAEGRHVQLWTHLDFFYTGTYILQERLNKSFVLGWDVSIKNKTNDELIPPVHLFIFPSCWLHAVWTAYIHFLMRVIKR